MNVNFSVKSIFMVIFFLCFALVSCNSEEEMTVTTENKVPTNIEERLTTSDKVRTEDMIIFRTKIHQAIKKGEKGNKQQYENILLEAAIEFLDFNNVVYYEAESKSALFSKALTLYSDRMNELNSPKN